MNLEISNHSIDPDKFYTIVKDNGATHTRVNRKEGKDVIVCSVCSKDGDAYCTSNLSTLKNPKSYCCPCSKGYKYSEQEFIRRVERLFKNTYHGNLKFLGWAEKYKGSKTRLKVYNIPEGFCSTSVTLNHLFCKGYTDTILRSKRLRSANIIQDDKYFLDKLQEKVGIPTGVTLKRLGTRDSWLYICKVCENDPIAKGGGRKSFKTLMSNLLMGKTPCRCSKAHKYNPLEWKIRSQNRIDGVGHFKTLEGRYFTWVCYKGHENRTFKTNESKPVCSTCNVSENWLYLTRWRLPSGKSFLKFGITRLSELPRRIKSQERKTEAVFEEVELSLYYPSRDLAYKYETIIKEKLDTRYVSKRDFGDGYTETLEDNQENIKFIANLYLTKS